MRLIKCPEFITNIFHGHCSRFDADTRAVFINDKVHKSMDAVYSYNRVFSFETRFLWVFKFNEAYSEWSLVFW